MPLQLRRGTEVERQTMNQPLQEGEPLFITDENTLYIGVRNPDGSLPLPRDLHSTNNYTDDHARAAITNMLQAGYHPNVNYYYDDDDNTLHLNLILGNISQDITPQDTGIFSIGTYDNQFKKLHVSDQGINIGEANITAIGNSIKLPSTSIEGIAIFQILSIEPDGAGDGTVAIADGIGWDPAGTGTQTMVVKLNGTWITIAAGVIPS